MVSGDRGLRRGPQEGYAIGLVSGAGRSALARQGVRGEGATGGDAIASGATMVDHRATGVDIGDLPNKRDLAGGVLTPPLTT